MLRCSHKKYSKHISHTMTGITDSSRMVLSF